MMSSTNTEHADPSISRVVLTTMWICLKLTIFVFLAQTESMQFIYAGF